MALFRRESTEKRKVYAIYNNWQPINIEFNTLNSSSFVK